MEDNWSSDNELTEPSAALESASLLTSYKAAKLTFRERLGHANFRPKGLCLPSKAAVLILVWMLVVSAIYSTIQDGTLAAISINRKTATQNSDLLLTYLVFVLMSMLYPFAGFIADVCCGRYKTVIVSLCFLLCGFACIGLTIVLNLEHVVESPFIKATKRKNPGLFCMLVGSGILFIILGLSGFHANIIQLGLDQLMDASSEYLGLFVHWIRWITILGTIPIRPLFLEYIRCKHKIPKHEVMALGPLLFIALLIVIVFSCWKHRWFYSEPGSNNPYKTVFKVLNFARKNKYPLRRSAFTFNGDENPGRIDFAKEKYGGPFTTEQVEDVKTFFRILVILVVVGPAFFLDVPGTALLYQYANHTANSHDACTWPSLFQDMPMVGRIMMVTTFPVYIYFLYSVLRRCIPKTFIRIWIGKFLLVVGLTAMFLIDLSGHALYYQRHQHMAKCMFRKNDHHSYNLGLPWEVNIVPVFLTQAGITLVITTTFEFISAQSPRSMKGLLIGVFYVIKGTFSFIGTLCILPFSMTKDIWETNKNGHSVVNCGFGYYLLSCLIGALGLVLFYVAAKKYHYRERDDPPYNQMNVETVWANG